MELGWKNDMIPRLPAFWPARSVWRHMAATGIVWLVLLPFVVKVALAETSQENQNSGGALKQLSLEQAKEIAADQHAALVQFLRGSDILVLDAQYTDQEYKTHVGWGHGSISSAVSLALEAEVQTLLLFHHDPSHDDDMVDTMVKSARDLVEKSGRLLEVAGAQQGSEILLEAKKIAAA